MVVAERREGQLARRPAAQGALPAQPGEAPERLMRFTVGGFPYALPLERAAEVLAIGSVMATAPRGWIGTLVRNERPVPIGDLAFLLGVAPVIASRRDIRAIIIRDWVEGAMQTRFGVTVEHVPEVVVSLGERIEALPALARRNPHILASGSVILGDELVVLLDADLVIARLDAGVVRAADGRITELRALPRRQGETVRLTMPPGGVRTATALQQETPALLLPGVEAADGGGGFIPALPMAWVREVRPAQAPRPLPQAPAALQGLIVWRGRSLPVIDLVQRLTGIPSGPASVTGRRLVIVGLQGDDPLGAIIVPGVRGLATLGPAPARGDAPPELLDPALLHAWTWRGDELVALLDPPACFA